MRRTYKLGKIDDIINLYQDEKNHQDINHILDLYAIYQLIKDGNSWSAWTQETYDEYASVAKQFPQIVGKFVSTICDENFIDLYNQVSTINRFDFWNLFDNFKLYEKISVDKFSELLKLKIPLYNILAFRKIVEKYDECLTEYISSNENCIEIVLNRILSCDGNTSDIIIPKSLTPKAIVELAEKYVESTQPNPNFLDLIANSRSEDRFPITDEIRLKAKNKHREYWEEARESTVFLKQGIEVIFQPNDGADSQEEYAEHNLKFTYNSNWISENLDYPTLLNNFVYLFNFCDMNFRSLFVYKASESSAVERIFLRNGKDDYPVSYLFNIKNKAFSLKLIGYITQLNKHGIVLEELFEWFFKTYLKEEFNLEGFVYLAPSQNTTTLEKCILLASSIDAILKQFIMYQKHGQVNRALFEMSSGHVKFSEIKSCLDKKYVYANSNDLIKELYLLFSDQSMLGYIEKTKEKYDTFLKLLVGEDVTMDDFYEYQHANINWLIKRGSIVLDNNVLKLNVARVSFLKDLYDNEVSCYAYNKKSIELIEKLAGDSDVNIESTLFSIPEQKYLNYILNRSEFSNGLDLRNKYVHGTYSLDINQQEKDYNELLKIMILIVIKINEEFCLKFSQQP